MNLQSVRSTLDQPVDGDVFPGTVRAVTSGQCWYDPSCRGSAQRGSFAFIDTATGSDAPVLVRYSLPAGLHSQSPVLFVLPGIERDSRPYFRAWRAYAARAGAILLVPELPRCSFPFSRGYNLGNMFDKAGRPIERRRWAFSLIERLFDHVRAETGNRRNKYLLFGHSAGGQLVHRMVLFCPEARIESAVAANAGWYTLPDLSEDYPYGLHNTAIDGAQLKNALERPLTILVGGNDIDENHPNLRRAPGAVRQGKNRLHRALSFVVAGRDAALAHGASLAWRFALIPNVGHNQDGMVAAAAARLLPELEHRSSVHFGGTPVSGAGITMGELPKAIEQGGSCLKNFVPIRINVSVQSLLDEIERQPDAWSRFIGRQTKYSVHAETLSIPIRGAVRSHAHGRKRRDIQRSRFTTISGEFPLLVDFLRAFATERNAELGRAKLVKLPPGGKVHPHSDRGEYYKNHDRYHLVVRSEDGSYLRSGDEAVRMKTGELWWFDNKEIHEARNDSDEDRIHLIFDLLPRGNLPRVPHPCS